VLKYQCTGSKPAALDWSYEHQISRFEICGCHFLAILGVEKASDRDYAVMDGREVALVGGD